MAITIISPANSFIRFGESEQAPLCIWGNINFCLPVYDPEDVYFQFIINGTSYEIDSLCTQDASEITVELVTECGDTPLLTFAEKPERFRLGETQVLYNWRHGLPGFQDVVAVNKCFKIQLTIIATPYGYPDEDLITCSNCFERIASDCFTSVVEYSNEEDAFGFKYCDGGMVAGGGDDPSVNCDPVITTFVNESTLSIPYTAYLHSKFGDFPDVKAWIYDGTGQLINMGITIAFDTYRPTMINLDFGGPASGIVVMR